MISDCFRVECQTLISEMNLLKRKMDILEKAFVQLRKKRVTTQGIKWTASPLPSVRDLYNREVFCLEDETDLKLEEIPVCMLRGGPLPPPPPAPAGPPPAPPAGVPPGLLLVPPAPLPNVGGALPPPPPALFLPIAHAGYW